ncbi:MAG: TIGR04076 family protein [Gemmatimonadota bacterium]
MSRPHETFTLHDLRVDVVGTDRPMVCGHRAGEWFELSGEMLHFPTGGFPLYPLAALLPILPAMQRATEAADWMNTDNEVACPDPHCGARFRITRTGTRTFRHADVSAVPMPGR